METLLLSRVDFDFDLWQFKPFASSSLYSTSYVGSYSLTPQGTNAPNTKRFPSDFKIMRWQSEHVKIERFSEFSEFFLFHFHFPVSLGLWQFILLGNRLNGDSSIRIRFKLKNLSRKSWMFNSQWTSRCCKGSLWLKCWKVCGSLRFISTRSLYFIALSWIFDVL